MKKLCALACAGLVLGGCAGRDPSPVSAHMPSDAELECREIDSEIQRNNEALRVRIAEDAETQNKNIVVGTAAFLLFAPVAFAMDFKGAAETEAHAFEHRNRTLVTLASRKRCQTVHAMTVPEAVAEREAGKAAATVAGDSDMQGERVSTDPRLHQASAVSATASPAAVQASAEPVDRDRLHDLMDRFLRGEISKAEYERLRAG